MIIGLEIYYISRNLIPPGTTEKEMGMEYDVWRKKPWLSFTVLATFLKFFYEVYHHYSDLLYTFSFPHKNTMIAVILLVFIWLPFMYNLYVVTMESWSFLSQNGGWSSLFAHSFVISGTVSIRKFYRAITNNLVHLFI